MTNQPMTNQPMTKDQRFVKIHRAKKMAGRYTSGELAGRGVRHRWIPPIKKNDTTMSEQQHSRRDFLLRLSALGAMGTVMAACGGGESGQTATPEPAAPAAPEPTADAGCTDLSGLSDADRAQSEQMRTSLGYIEETADAAKRCDNCALWVAAEEGSSCGGCTLIKGPIAPAGFCNSWAQVQA